MDQLAVLLRHLLVLSGHEAVLLGQLFGPLSVLTTLLFQAGIALLEIGLLPFKFHLQPFVLLHLIDQQLHQLGLAQPPQFFLRHALRLAFRLACRRDKSPQSNSSP